MSAGHVILPFLLGKERTSPLPTLLTTRATMLFPAETFLLTTVFPLKSADFPVGLEASSGLCSATCLPPGCSNTLGQAKLSSWAAARPRLPMADITHHENQSLHASGWHFSAQRRTGLRGLFLAQVLLPASRQKNWEKLGDCRRKYNFSNQEQATEVKLTLILNTASFNTVWWMAYCRLFCKTLSLTFSFTFLLLGLWPAHRDGHQEDSLCCWSAVAK